MSVQLFLTRRNLLTLLSKLDRVTSGEFSSFTIVKRGTEHPKYSASDIVVVAPMEDENYYTDRMPGPIDARDGERVDKDLRISKLERDLNTAEAKLEMEQTQHRQLAVLLDDMTVERDESQANHGNLKVIYDDAEAEIKRMRDALECILDDAVYTHRHESPGPELKGYLQTVRGTASAALADQPRSDGGGA